MRRTRHAAATALALAVLPAAPAGAQTAIFSDDAEGAIDAKWVVGEPPPSIEPWQKSDSATTKFRGNQFHGGAASYWSGVQPQNWPPVPTTAGPGTVVEGESVMTLKEPIVIPADGQTQLKYWSMFQNEGDDAGISQIAVFGADGKLGPFKNLKSETATSTAAGDTDPRACDPSRPDSPVAFEEQTVDLKSYLGYRAVLRFNLKYGPENRPVSHPCGWYVDDIRVLTTGTPGRLAGAAAPATGPATAPATAPRPAVRFGALKRSRRKATLTLTVSGAPISGASATLSKGRRRVAVAKAKRLAPGTRRLTFKLRRRLAKGSYTVRLTGRDPAGAAVIFTARTRAR